ncbi:hypothetical protein J6590_052195 [Homalodisca vitripennis]|nr:hypothetical protein J6590_052195 [Homalodisca vitripennis]
MDRMEASSEPAAPVKTGRGWHAIDLHLGNPMDVQERHIANHKCRDIGAKVLINWSSLLQRKTLKLGGAPVMSKGIASPNKSDYCYYLPVLDGTEWSPFFMTEINVLNSSSWISTGGGP